LDQRLGISRPQSPSARLEKQAILHHPQNGLRLTQQHLSVCHLERQHRRTQTWALDLAAKTWTQMNPAKEPDTSSSRSRNLSFVPSENLFVLELCAPEKSGRGPELWTYRYKKAEPPFTPANLVALTDKNKVSLKWEPPAP